MTRTAKAISQLITDAERSARILVVDDELGNLNVLMRTLQRAGFIKLHGIHDARTVLKTIVDFQPDVILLDLHMPGVDGIELLQDIKALQGRRNYLPVLVLTGDACSEARDAALAAGARDFLTKPYDPGEVILRVRNLIETRLLNVELSRQNALLSERFESRTEELEAAKLEILERLARAADFRDEASYGHTTRVGELSARIAAQIGYSEAEVQQIRIAARLHDIGKIGLSDSILMKPGPLAPAEFLAQERHTLIGANILSGSRFPILRLAEEIALTHHESWDGNGYPRGLRGEEIPMCGRIVAVADVFDALTHERAYKTAWRLDDAIDEIKHQSGQKFDPAVVKAFLQIAAKYVSFDGLEEAAQLDARAKLGAAVAA
ncbi:MAG TPA: HD domain-containing phosphohydrolase [Longimicrobiales bacterium]|nr:HD domain-containing phosphohydrolase [Longimicrobiales bacterium]